MKESKQNFVEFLKTPLGTIIIFIVLFYGITFAVYYFYSPGPEERKQAELEAQSRLSSMQQVTSQQ
jgi:flagellar biosynthesis/type III secretory pathway M-ring protein FliF/YscJ